MKNLKNLVLVASIIIPTVILSSDGFPGWNQAQQQPAMEVKQTAMRSAMPQSRSVAYGAAAAMEVQQTAMRSVMPPTTEKAMAIAGSQAQQQNLFKWLWSLSYGAFGGNRAYDSAQYLPNGDWAYLSLTDLSHNNSKLDVITVVGKMNFNNTNSNAGIATLRKNYGNVLDYLQKNLGKVAIIKNQSNPDWVLRLQVNSDGGALSFDYSFKNITGTQAYNNSAA